VQSKASTNQLDLPQGTETKPEMVKNGGGALDEFEAVVLVGDGEVHLGRVVGPGAEH